MRSTTVHPLLAAAPVLWAPLLAAVVCVGTINRPGFDAPDLEHELIRPEPGAAAAMSWGRALGASLPPERPDLGVYRPAHGLLLKLQYAWWPGQARSFHALSVAIFVLFCTVAAFGLRAVVGVDSPAAAWGVLAGVTVVALHPAAADAVNPAAAQGILLAGVGWVAAHGLYALVPSGKIRPAWGASGLALIYLIAASAHEAALLLPLSLKVFEFLGERPTPKVVETRARRGGGRAGSVEPTVPVVSLDRLRRLLIYGFPLLGAALLLIFARRQALDGRWGPVAAFQFMGESPVVQRWLVGWTAMGEGWLRLIFPFRPIFFHEVGAGELGVALTRAAVGWGVWVGVVILAWRRLPGVVLGAALAMVPLLAFAQWVPTTVYLSEGALILALAGLALIAAGFVKTLTERFAAPHAPGLALTAGIALALILPTIGRNRLWRESERYWSREASRRPQSPRPPTYELIDLVSRQGRGLDLARATALFDQAAERGSPPATDPAFQFMALAYLAGGQPEAFQALLERALAQPAPHGLGFYRHLGAVALRMGLPQLAEQAFTAELQQNPEDFETLYSLADLALRREDWTSALARARLATQSPPRHLAAQAFAQRGRGAARLGLLEEAVLALRKAIDLDPTLAEPYVELARALIAAEDYAAAESVLVEGRDRARVRTLAPLFAVHVESLERQGKASQIFDFLREMTRRYSWDEPLLLYAASYFAAKGRFPAAREAYASVLTRNPTQPDALVGLGKLTLIEEGDSSRALGFFLAALRSDPRHDEARRILTDLGHLVPESPSDPSAGGTPSETSASSP